MSLPDKRRLLAIAAIVLLGLVGVGLLVEWPARFATAPNVEEPDAVSRENANESNVLAVAPSHCTKAPPLTKDEVAALVAAARKAQPELPRPYESYTTKVRRDGCYYLYAEYPQPSQQHGGRSFMLNQNGVLVDVSEGFGNFTTKLTCPDRDLSEAELSEIIRSARARRADLPAPFDEYEILVTRLRCMYTYTERAIPKIPGGIILFSLDPFGEIMRVRGGHTQRRREE